MSKRGYSLVVVLACSACAGARPASARLTVGADSVAEIGEELVSWVAPVQGPPAPEGSAPSTPQKTQSHQSVIEGLAERGNGPCRALEDARAMPRHSMRPERLRRENPSPCIRLDRWSCRMERFAGGMSVVARTIWRHGPPAV